MLTAGNDIQYNRLCDAVGRPDLASHELFYTNVERVKHRDALTEAFDAIFREDTVDNWLAKLDAFEELFEQGVIAIGNSLDQVIAKLLCLVQQRCGNLFHVILRAHRLVMPQDRLHLH